MPRSFPGPLALIVTVLLMPGPAVHATSPESPRFVYPGHGVDQAQPVWGHRDGLRIGIAPTPGPRGLIRIYAPYLDQQYPRVVNFVSIEPSVAGQPGRDQSELAISQHPANTRGLMFSASNHRDQPAPTFGLAAGTVDSHQQKLTIFIHSEPFPNGARPIIECVFHAAKPHEVQFIVHSHPDGTEMSSCVLSATMGNYGLLRQIHLRHQRVVNATSLWDERKLDPLGFLPWHQWSAEQLTRLDDGRLKVWLSTDTEDMNQIPYAPDTFSGWRYQGTKAIHYWIAPAACQPWVAVNGRETYWQSSTPIPGGVAFENFELRLPYAPAQSVWFGITPDQPDADQPDME